MIETPQRQKGLTPRFELTLEEIKLIQHLRQLEKRGWDRFLVDKTNGAIMICTIGRPEAAKGE